MEEQYNNYNNNGLFKGNVEYRHQVCDIDEDLMKEIRASQKEAMSTSIPHNYIKVDERIITSVYKIPNDEINTRKYNIRTNKESNDIIRGKYKINTMNNNNIYNIKRNNDNYQMELSPSRKNQNCQTQNNFYRNIICLNNNFISKRSKSPTMTFSSTQMNSFNNCTDCRYRSPVSSIRSHNIIDESCFNSPKSPNKRNKIFIRYRNKNVPNNREEKNINNNKLYEDKNTNSGLYCENIFLDKNYNNPYNYKQNSYIIRTPASNSNKNYAIFNSNKFIGSPKKVIECERIQNFSKNNKDKDDKYIIEEIYNNKRTNKLNKDYELNLNENKNDFRRPFRNCENNFKYLNINEERSPINFRKNYHTQKIQSNNCNSHNCFMKGQQKVYIKALPKGKIIRLYVNNNNNFIHHSPNKNSNMTYKRKCKKEEYDYYYIK